MFPSAHSSSVTVKFEEVLNGVAQGVVGHDVEVWEDRTSVGAGVVAGSKPLLDAGAVVAVAVGANNGVSHYLSGYRANEATGDRFWGSNYRV